MTLTVLGSWVDWEVLSAAVAPYRLLLEESDEEEGDLCRICQMGEDSASNPLLQPCRCTGSLQFVHQDCIKRWLCSKIHSGDLQNLQNLSLSPTT